MALTKVQGGMSAALVSGTAVASTSGTSIDFTGIPSWVKRITVMCNQLSTNGSSIVQIQVGSGSVTTSGYVGSSGFYNAPTAAQFTTGFGIEPAGGATLIRQFVTTLTLLGSNTWIGATNIGYSHAAVVGQSCGSVTLSGTLDRVRITTVNGTDTFDAGSINILYE